MESPEYIKINNVHFPLVFFEIIPNNCRTMQVQKNVLSPTRQMTAKTGAQIPRSPPTRGIRRSTVAPRQRDPSFPLQPLRPAAFSRPCWSRQHPPSPRVPAPCPRENSDIAPSGKTERLLWLRSQKRRANPPMNLWIQ